MRAAKNSDGQDEEADPRVLRRYAKISMVDGHPWFFRMSGDRKDTGLIGYYGPDATKQGFMVAIDAPGYNKMSKRFALFTGVEDFYQSVVEHPPRAFSGDHYYEIVGATTPEQKPYFDIDIDPRKFPDDIDAEFFACKMIWLIIAVVRDQIHTLIGVDSSSFRMSVYSTIYPKKVETGLPKKFSYHLVVQGVHFAGHEDMKRFGDLIKAELLRMEEIRGDRLAIRASEAIDVIWFKTRQFRLLGSSKLGSTAVKIRINDITLQPERIYTDARSRLRVLTESCVSIIPSTSRLIKMPRLADEESN